MAIRINRTREKKDIHVEVSINGNAKDAHENIKELKKMIHSFNRTHEKQISYRISISGVSSIGS